MSRITRLAVRRALPAAVVALLAVVASGCDWAQSPAAKLTAGSRSITVSGSQFRRLVTLKKHESLTDPTTGNKVDHIPLSDASALLSLRIRYGYFEDEARRRNVSVSSSDVAAARQAINQDPSAASIPTRFKEWLAGALAAENAVAADVAKHASAAEREAAARALFDQVMESQSQICSDFVSSADKAVAGTAAAAVRAGTTFAAAGDAARKSDPQAQASSSPQCIPVSNVNRFPPALADALTKGKIGEIQGPIEVSAQGQTAYYVIRVSERREASFEELRPQLEAQYGRTKLTDEQTKFLQKAKVTIDPRYGTWDRTTLQVKPPEGLPSKFSKLLNGSSPSPSPGLGSTGSPAP